MTRFLEDHLDDWAIETPDATAFRFGKDSLTYGALAAASDRIARLLASLGVGPGDQVGIYMDQCLDMPAAVYGILKSGAAYVPLDASAPVNRTAAIVNAAEIKTILSQNSKSTNCAALADLCKDFKNLIGAEVADLQCFDIDADAPKPTVAPHRSTDDTAYILFTSGSTGTPKGMVHTHVSGAAYVDMAASLFDLRASDRIGNHSPLHFDVAMLAFFSIISKGGTSVLIPEMLTKLPASLSQLIQDEKLTVWYSVPFALIQLVEYGVLDKRDLTSLRWIIYAGAPMSARHLHTLQTDLPKARFSNAYGPAEANQVTYYHLPKEPHPLNLPVPIGYPCAHTDIAFDDGELLISSPALMREYLGRDDLNESAFTQIDGQRFYRTGDLVTQSDDGTLNYLGRRDRQVKIRGIRVELDEVELTLSAHETVSEVAVQVAQDGLTLEAFVTSAAGHQADAKTLDAHVRSLLPAAFVPARFEILRAFERTATGKINRTALRMSA